MAARAAGSLGRRKVPENALLAPLSGRPLPELSAGQESALPQWEFRAAALGRIPALAAGCLCPPSAFVRRGLHEMAATALRHFVSQAGGSRGGGRTRGDHCARRPCVAWTEPSAGPALARPWPGRPGLGTSRHPGRAVGSAGPSPRPARPSRHPRLPRQADGMLPTRAQSSCN